MQHPKFYTFSISSSRFHLYLLILSISFLRFHPYFFILDILSFTYNPPSFQALKLHPEQFHNGILRLVISFLLFHPYHFISPNISLLFHTIYFHLLYRTHTNSAPGYYFLAGLFGGSSNGILRLVISFLLFHPYHFISPNISLLFHTIYFHLLYFIL